MEIGLAPSKLIAHPLAAEVSNYRAARESAT